MKRFSILLVMLAMLGLSVAPPAFGAGASETVRGTLEIVHGDDFDGHSHHNHADPGNAPLPNMEYWLNSGSVLTRLEFAGTVPSLPYGAKLAVTGERRDGRLAVSSYRVEAAPGGNSGKKGGGGTTTPPPTYIGARDVLVVLVKFADTNASLLKSPETLRTEVFTGTASSSEYFRESSYGKTWLKGKNDGSTTGADVDNLPGDVTEWNTITGNTTSCKYSDWGLQGRNAAGAAGWNLSGYEHIVHVFPKTAACQWGGLGQLGGTYTWINGATEGGNSRSFVVTHEIGHNISLHHARSWECTVNGLRVAFAQTCDSLEYGDDYEVMGRGYSRLNARSTPHLGWLPSTSMQTVTDSGTYTIQPIDGPAVTGFQSLRIPRSSSDYLWIEARSKATNFDGRAQKAGVLLHTGPNIGSVGSTYLIDGDAHTPEQTDAAFEEGEAFVDTVANIYVKVVSVDPTTGAVTVEIKTGYSNAVPTGNAGPSTSTTTADSHTHTGATASDRDSNLMKYEWSWTSCPSTCPALNGATGPLEGAGGDVPGPSYTPQSVGDHTLKLTVWDSTGASTTSSVTSTPAAPAPSSPTETAVTSDAV